VSDSDCFFVGSSAAVTEELDGSEGEEFSNAGDSRLSELMCFRFPAGYDNSLMVGWGSTTVHDCNEVAVAIEGGGSTTMSALVG
jgi:hypothetical protein